MIEQKILTNLGLTEKQAKIYLACLELGQASVLKISRHTGIKRATIYINLDEMVEKGFIKEVPKKTTTVYTAVEPKSLLYNLQQKEKDLADLLPYLQAKYNRGEKPSIAFYEGKESVKTIYYEIYSAEEIMFFATSMSDFQKEFSESFNYGLRKFKKEKTKVREIVSSAPGDIKYAKENQNKIHQIKIAPSHLKFFADSAIYNNKLVISSIRDKFYAIVIEDKKIVDSYRSIFELAWQSAVEVDSL